MNTRSNVHMSPSDPLTELAEILAIGLLRMKARSKQSASCGESSVDCAGDQSVHAGDETRMESS